MLFAKLIILLQIAKASLPQHSLYSVFSTLQGGIWL
jgi:hypothetical protein